MLDVVLLWGPGAIIALGVLFFLHWIWFRFPERTANDVVGFLQHVDVELAHNLVDPIAEGHLRSSMTRKEFRQAQRKRIHLCMEVIKRMSHNANILLELANKELRNEAPEISRCARLLQEKSVEVKVYSLVALCKLRVRVFTRVDSWLLFFGDLSLCDMREACGIRGIERYDELKTAASVLFLQLKSSQFEELMTTL